MWETERLYLDGDAFYSALIAEVDSARSSVDMEVYTFETGVLAERLCDAFLRAQQRAVRVRLIFDHWGSPDIHSGLYHRLQAAGVNVRIFRGLPWRMLQTGRGHSPHSLRGSISECVRRIKTLNRGFHRKVTIVDGSSAWISSLNVTDVHLREVSGPEAWMDVGIRVSGADVRVLSTAFNRVFGGNLARESRNIESNLILLNDTRFTRGRMNNRIRERIGTASRRIWIQNPYFLPPRRILRALCKAAKRGTEVLLLVPAKNDFQLIRWMNLGMMQRLRKSGVRILEHHGMFAHKKVFIVDDEMFLGSVNFNYRSLLHDLEVEVKLTHATSKAALEASFRRDQLESIEWTPPLLESLPLWQRWLSRLLFFFRYWC